METVVVTFTDSDDEVQKVKKTRPTSLALQFYDLMMENLPERAAKSWKNFEYFLELFFAFAVFSPTDIEGKWTGETTLNAIPFDKEGEAYKLGIGFYYRKNMLEVLGDFVLGDKSPMAGMQQRVQMGTSYTKPSFGPLMGTITTMMTDKEMIKKYPLSENSKKILESKHILSMLMSPENNFTSMLNSMCVNNYQLTKKMAKVYVKNFNRQNIEQMDSSLRELQTFMLIDDSLKKCRFDWIFGVCQVTVTRY